MSTLPIRDVLRREAYLTRFSWAVQDFPKYVRLKRELRAELTATASEVGMRRAVADLGSPRALADGYLAELDRSVPRWTTGATAAALTLSAVVALWLAYSLGTLNTLEQTGGGSTTVTFLGSTTTYVFTDAAISQTSELSWQFLVFLVLAVAVPLVLGSRAWRLWSRAARPAEMSPST
jgi:hypothetical protein